MATLHIDIENDYLELDKKIRACLRRNNCPIDHIDDVTQEVFIKLNRYSKLTEFESPGRLMSYVFDAVRCVYFNYMRKEIGHPELSKYVRNSWYDHNSYNTSYIVEEKNAMDYIRQRAKQLPNGWDIILEKRLNGESYEQIAHSLNIPEGTVMSVLHRAKLKIQNEMLSNN